jgi:hypothetical protein
MIQINTKMLYCYTISIDTLLFFFGGGGLNETLVSGGDFCLSA